MFWLENVGVKNYCSKKALGAKTFWVNSFPIKKNLSKNKFMFKKKRRSKDIKNATWTNVTRSLMTCGNLGVRKFLYQN